MTPASHTTAPLALNRWSHTAAIGAKGVSLVVAELYEHQIVPCVPLLDIGYDLITAHNQLLKRVQVKATQIDPDRNGGAFTFSIRRRKTTSVARAPALPSMSYADNEVDAFVFVQTRLQEFFVVPAAEIDLARHKLSFWRTSPWYNAWHVLKS